jgi:hypothetical protein
MGVFVQLPVSLIFEQTQVQMEWSISGAAGLSSSSGASLERVNRYFQGEWAAVESLYAWRADWRKGNYLLRQCK